MSIESKPLTPIRIALVGSAFVLSSMWPFVGYGEGQVQLAALTVPQDGLPRGCRLAPEMPGSISENPWVGNNAVKVASIRAAVEGPPPTITDPIRRGTRTRSTEHVIEAYRARYLAERGGWVDVSAVRFDEPKWTAAAALMKLEGKRPRIILGPIAVHVSRSTPWIRAKGSDLVQTCYEAVRGFISAIALPR